MRKALLILAMPIVLLMVGCAEEDAARDPQVNGSAMVKGMPIDFGADDAGDTTRISPYLTRTAVNILNLSGVQTSGFGVFAAHTGLHTYANSSISSNFMYNQKVTYSSSNWTYSPIKYWPNGEDGSDLPDYISFFAYAPYSETASACITDFPLPIEMGDPWLIYRLADDVASQVDLLFATPVFDKTKPASTATAAEKKVQFKFKHALACVGDKVTTSVSEELGNLLKDEVTGNASLDQITILLNKVSIVYTLTQKGKLSLASSTALWKPVMSGEFTTKRTVTVFDGSASPFTLATITDAVVAYEHSVSDKGVFYIPLQVGNEPQQATCTIDYSIVRTFSDASTTTFNGNTTNTIGLQAAGGEVAGEHLSLNLNLSENIRVKPYDFTGFSILPINDVIYTGSALEPVVVVTNGNKTLVKDVDYTVSYTNNINVGVGTVTIHGMGAYDTDVTLTANFNINRRDISSFTVTGINDVVYNGSEQTMTPVVKYGETTLEAGVDYTVTGASYTNAGQYTVIITGKGNYTGTIARQWNITQKPLTITANAQTVTYGTAITQGTNQVTTNSLCAGHTLSAITLTQSTTNATTNGTITPSAATIMHGSNNVTSNYNITYNTGTLTINKAAPTYTAPTAKTNLVYNGSEQTLINAGSATGGTMCYSFDNSIWYNNADMMKRTNANTSGYTVYFKVVGDENHNDVAPASINVAIAKANGWCLLPEDESSNWGKTEMEIFVAFEVNHHGGTLSYSKSGAAMNYISVSISGNSVTISKPENIAGFGTVTITSSATTNYNAASATFTCKP